MTSDETAPASKRDVLASVREAYGGLLKLIEPLDDDQFVLPIQEGGWSPKDLLAHIADWERYVVLRVEACRRGETPPVWGPDDEQVDEKNAELLAANRTLSPAAARQKAQEAHDDVVAMIESLTEAELLDDTKRHDVMGEWPSPVWLHLAANTYWHYEEHAEALKAWLNA